MVIVSEENLSVDGENVVVDDLNSEGENPENKKTEDKKFTQTEVNRMIQSRLKKEKESVTSLQTNWESEKSSYVEQIDSYEKIINSFLETQKAALSEREKKFFEKLTLVDQVEFLSESLTEVSRKDLPKNPKVSDTTEKTKVTKYKNFLGGN